MKQLKIKAGEKKDHAEIIAWLNSNPANQFDERILAYPTLEIITAYGDRNVLHLPVHRALVMESLAVSPDATEMEKAQALRDVTKSAEYLASRYGIKELYFQISEEQVKKIASNKDVGFELVTMARMKL